MLAKWYLIEREDDLVSWTRDLRIRSFTNVTVCVHLSSDYRLAQNFDMFLDKGSEYVAIKVDIEEVN